MNLLRDNEHPADSTAPFASKNGGSLTPAEVTILAGCLSALLGADQSGVTGSGSENINGGGRRDGCMETDWKGHPASSIFVATNQDDVKHLTTLLQRPDMQRHVNDLDGDGCGILHGYALNPTNRNAHGIVRALVQAGGDVNLKSRLQETPLQIAVLYSFVDMVHALLENGARLDVTDWKGDTPLTTARAKCQHQHADGGTSSSAEDCCRVLRLIVQAEKKTQRTRERREHKLQKRADHLRHRGNTAYQKKLYTRAYDLYTASLEVVEDPRTYSNRAACRLEIAKKAMIRGDNQDDTESSSSNTTDRLDQEGLLELTEQARIDASLACRVQPRLDKAHYRLAAADLLARDFVRAKQRVQTGLEVCPESKKLTKLLGALNGFGTPDDKTKSDGAIAGKTKNDSNPIIELMTGAPHDLCRFCCRSVPLSHFHDDESYSSCPFCLMNLKANVQKDDITNFLLKL